jgi:methanogenic corrinoid protein MtbC1
MDQNSNFFNPLEDLVKQVADLNESDALAIVRQRIARGDKPFDIVEDCKAGMQIIGQRYEKQEYFLSGLIMGGEIFREVMQLLNPLISDKYHSNELGKILLGTVAGDIHDIGKNILSMLVTSYGFTVFDLGVDVPAEEFSQKARELKPDIIGLSGLLTSSFDSMKNTIKVLRSTPDIMASAMPIVIGGSTVDHQTCMYVGADHWANDAMVGVNLFKQLIVQK